MKHTLSIKLNRDFKRLYYKGGCAGCDLIVIYYKRAVAGRNRLGITVGTKIGGAVVRNRVKRLIRESYRLSEDELVLGYDIVIVARSKAVNASFAEISGAMRRLLKQKGLLKTEKPDNKSRD